MIESIIFGFGHRARQGKDLAAAAIIEARSGQYNIKRYSFGQELKREVTKNALSSGGMHRLFDDGLRGPDAGFMQTNGNVLSLPDWVQYETDPDMSDPDCPLGKQRSLLQFWGTEYRRSVDPDYWIKKVAERIAEEKPEVALITDVRFPNEMFFCLKYGEVIKVVRPGVPSPNAHASETALAGWPDNQWSAVIYNDGTLEQLKQQAVYVFDDLLETQP
jgi:hypothetical protein